ncbi:DegT/DnrJ/EryC1/StrS family aminotransferase [Brachyspira hyodysenteriae]|uniref:DegT/DnrJ/EryC1/StrS family aminotransferase n=1 Tax=Brachyspira hyodysenteriae TaxID=159 RepID=UPI0022CD4491|nr:DegT/DnrJ/EryC1/StrS family aminotransferase [Brachyspira hyodysenteriae]MCZ9869774.1 DegT/DnrJ/EryC1/StrS family aminotransferase [Brachyspira hyodysenteriae]MCZ9879466.1 DegT/DnrJ/EryC1/StrS family aminotransferase [Brachyspira hyodysenteriae]MCZ9897064.1 DegT/DnrJ/EryC1/StrS family aminotransferase [Brachyspira hyodysenteriae]MCZ9954211.1 DegT/DnrJ/EryC1/StrS family aminotransferase [Brachyspira hyodysenteriae]MCZ9972320.1 DegT/DnrJ/EryC1/StrS family aminotransferase [Brachyspira hyodyse
MNKKIPFSPPDITDSEIEAVVNVLKSGWITTGPVNKEFEEELCKYIDVKRVKLLSSATSAMELALKIFGVGEGDEVIVPAYTYASTANVVVHLGAKVVFIDAKEDDFNIDLERLEKAITNKTKAVIAVDIGGMPCDYDAIIKILESKKELFNASENKYQKELKRPLFLLDAAHSIGAIYKGKRTGSQADMSSFSFHAVKNITTSEGGALSFNYIGNINADEIYKEISVLSLHGQNKSAFDKNKGGKGAWRYNIELAGYKCNMSDLHAAIGLSQLRRYDSMLNHRKKIVSIYNDILGKNSRIILPNFKNNETESSYHLYLMRVKDFEEDDRDLLIDKMSEFGITLNVHYLPLPAHKAYIDLGYNIDDYKNAFNLYKNQITLPLYSTLKEEDAEYIALNIIKYLD